MYFQGFFINRKFIYQRRLLTNTLIHEFINLYYLSISGGDGERRSLGLRLDRNSCPISALSGLHHCHSQ